MLFIGSYFVKQGVQSFYRNVVFFFIANCEEWTYDLPMRLNVFGNHISTIEIAPPSITSSDPVTYDESSDGQIQNALGDFLRRAHAPQRNASQPILQSLRAAHRRVQHVGVDRSWMH